MLGSREAIIGALEKLSSQDAQVEVVKVGLGNITEADVAQAEGIKALIMGFQVQALPAAQSLAKEKKVFLQLCFKHLFRENILSLKTNHSGKVLGFMRCFL